MKKGLFGLLIALGLSICGCSTNNDTSGEGSGINDGDSFLSIGETNDSKNFTQSLVRMDYKPATIISDENKVTFELELLLHSKEDSIVALGGSSSYSATFDENKNNGGVMYTTSSHYPTSIAPGKDETVLLVLECFKDWKKAVVSYRDNNNYSYSFTIRSTDFPSKANNNYPVLKKGESFTNKDNALKVTFKNLEKTKVSGAYVAEGEDNLLFSVTLESLVDEKLTIPASYYNYIIKADGGFTSCGVSVGTPKLPSSIPAKETVEVQIIITINKNWEKLVFGYEKNAGKAEFKFNILHSDNTY